MPIKTLALITRDELSDDLRPELGWSVRGRQVYMGLRELLEDRGDPRTIRGQHRRALRGAQLDFLLAASRFSASHERIAATLGVASTSVERAASDRRALYERAFDPASRPPRIPTEEELR